MPIDYAALKTELATDPKALGLTAAINTGDCQTPANLLNALTGAGTGTITVPSLDNATFVTAFLPYLSKVFGPGSALTSVQQAYYQNVWNAILSMPAINFSSGNVGGVMTQAVIDGILTAAEAQALQQRTGSRAEVLFGAGTVISHLDVAQSWYRS